MVWNIERGEEESEARSRSKRIIMKGGKGKRGKRRRRRRRMKRRERSAGGTP